MMSICTCEFTCVGHPDKLCDLIADTVLDDLLFEDLSARCAVEVMATKGRIIVAGEITSSVKVSIRAAVRRALTRAGNIKPDKAKSTEKIDGVVATIMALDRAIRNGSGHVSGSVYDQRGLLVL